LSRNIRYPQAAFDKKKQGIVSVAIVKESGHLRSVDIVDHHGLGVIGAVDSAIRFPATVEKLPDGAYFVNLKFAINKPSLMLEGDVPQQYKSYIYLDPVYITVYKTAN